jgi:hypothetical protein
MKGEGVGRTSIHDAGDPHPALRAGLCLPGRGVSLLLRWKQPARRRPLCALRGGFPDLPQGALVGLEHGGERHVG